MSVQAMMNGVPFTPTANTTTPSTTAGGQSSSQPISSAISNRTQPWEVSSPLCVDDMFVNSLTASYSLRQRRASPVLE